MGEFSSQSLVQSLIDVVEDIASIGDFRRIHKKECANLARRVKLLAPLFEEIRELKGALPEEAISCFNALEKALHSAKQVLQLCHDGSKLYVVSVLAFRCVFYRVRRFSGLWVHRLLLPTLSGEGPLSKIDFECVVYSFVRTSDPVECKEFLIEWVMGARLCLDVASSFTGYGDG
jgi:hypothetical protein